MVLEKMSSLGQQDKLKRPNTTEKLRNKVVNESVFLFPLSLLHSFICNFFSTIRSLSGFSLIPASPPLRDKESK